jgi:steroid delta-isomerase-like uncharacterized protein
MSTTPSMRFATIPIAVACLGALAACGMSDQASPGQARDLVEVDPERYRVELENEHVRVLRVTYEPGAVSPMHHHRPYAFVFLTDAGPFRFTLDDGSVEERELIPRGTAGFGSAEAHEVEHLGTAPFEAVFIELKTAATASDRATQLRVANDEFFNKGNLAMAAEIFAPDYVAHVTDGSLRGGPAAIESFVNEMRTAFPDLHVEIQVLMTHEDRVTWVRTHRGTHLGDYMGVPASGRELTWQTMISTRYEGDRVAEEWAVTDLGERLRVQ